MTNQNQVFLSAEWNNLVLFNYTVKDTCLTPYIPRGCELDRFENSAFISLVAFQFFNTRVFGLKWPGFTHFLEVNLRFYVKFKNQRAVCFIREYVPSHIITKIARIIYNEPYKRASISGVINKTQNQISAAYQLTSGNESMLLDVTAENSPYLPLPTTMEHFFKEHEWGVGKTRKGETLIYRVEHPHWEIYPILDTKAEVNWESLYGSPFSFLNQQKPHSVIFAKGSKVKLFKADTFS